MRHLRGSGAVLVGLCVLPVVAHAQSAPPPYDSAIDIQNFDYSIGPKQFFTVDSADVADKKQLALDAVITFMKDPFVVYNTDGATDPKIMGTRDTVVSQMTAAQITGAYGINDKLQIGANLPLVFSESGDGLDPNTGHALMGGMQVTGLGDLLVEGKYQLYKNEANGLRFAGIAGITLPTSFGSDESKFLGDNLPTGRLRFAATWTSGKVSLGADGGIILRKPRTIYASTIGQQWTFGLGAAVAVTDKFSIIGEGYGRTGLTSFSLDESPMEVIGGLRLIVAQKLAVTLGGGAGLDQAIGAPNARFFGSVGYAPDVRDSDGDGVPNDRDKCPLIAEDKDDYQDDDGCPDDDNDGDRIPDSEDKCPNQSEDHDGFEDDDGCPDLDNDKDGIPDLQDKCPNDAEDGKDPYPKDGCPGSMHDSDGDGIPDSVDSCPMQEEDMDGFEDGDGCPEADNDNDGVPDAADRCPLCPEDKDGFADDDGCPDPDNDHDGILDAKDSCPNEAETFNGIKDEDGCPDTGGLAMAVKLDGDRLEVTQVPTLDGRNLSKTGEVIVSQMAFVMNSTPDVTKWLVALAQKTAPDAKRLADAVQARLIAKGVQNVQVIGAAGAPKIGGLVQERGDANAAMVGAVCPASAQVKPRPDTITPKAIMKDRPVESAPTVAPQPKPADKKPESKKNDDTDIDMGN
jgi:OmpA-OmpF porin, OOP family